MKNNWSAEVGRLVLILVPSLLVGLATGLVGWMIVLGLIVYLVWQAIQVKALLNWLQAGKRKIPPDVSGIWTDIYSAVHQLHNTNRKRKKKLSAMVNRFRESTAAMSDATVILAPDGSIEWFNVAARSLLGLRAPSDIGRRITHLIRDPVFIEYLHARDYAESLDMLSPADSSIHINLQIVPYGNKRRLLTVRDFTHIRQLENMRKDFIANISHEMRTPLTVISGYLETMIDGGETLCDADSQSNLRKMQEQSHRMRRIVEDLLNLSRLETSNRSGQDLSEVSVFSLVRDIHDEAAMLSGTAQHDFVLDVDEHLWLSGSVKELYSAFSNLVSNAVRYSPEGGEIHISWYQDDSGGHFVVQDQGAGIEAEHIERLTERFYRVNKDRSRDSGGTGLGLAIVKHVLQRHEATLEIASIAGSGSTFTCDFPPHRLIQKNNTSGAAINA